MMLLACVIAAPAKTGPEMNGRLDSIQRGSAGPSLPVVMSSYPAFVGKGSGIFFPLRSNAKSLVAGAPAQSVVARLKLASLLYDRVLVEVSIVSRVDQVAVRGSGRRLMAKLHAHANVHQNARGNRPATSVSR
jgi:hypothetical protein